MSLATLMLAFLPAAIVRPKIEPEKSAREQELTARVRELEGELAYVSLERDSARRRLDAAWDTMARVAEQRIDRRLAETPAQQRYAAMMQAQQAALAYQQGLANPLQQAEAYHQMQNANCTCVPGRGALLGAIGG